ncbi:MAG: NAD-dependent deacetylase [Actinomycetota bacterium]|nr:NAD-dependent deacetylase [Actinomycetota bacterium]
MKAIDEIDQTAGWVRSAEKVTVLTGAGVSTECGIPDFRGPNGVWTKDPDAEKLSHISYYMNDPSIRKRAWQLRLNHPARHAQPGRGHLALAELERMGHVHYLITQNIDGLHLKAGSSPATLVEIHGSMREVVCMNCGERAPMEKALDRVRAGEADPACRTCGGILKSSTISFGQNLVAEDLERAQRAAMNADVFIAAGTSLTVFPVAQLPQLALGAGARLVIFNEEPTPYDSRAHAIVRGSLGETLPKLVAAVSH